MSVGKFTDPRDGKKYRTVKIGEQTWMAQNLNYNTKGSKCHEDNTFYCNKYGRLYGWEIAMIACPEGWHLPSNAEWLKLIDFTTRDDMVGKKLKAKIGWCERKGKSGNGTDDFGFSALPGGGGFSDEGFEDLGKFGFWWSANEYNFNEYNYNVDLAYSLCIRCDSELTLRGGYDKDLLYSVRCLQD
jgi:uncharacterized protein (TIGR02145 family)